MNEVTNLRRLRLKHGVTLAELARAGRVSNQQISRVELLGHEVTPKLEQKYEKAMEAVIVRRYDAVRALEHDYRTVKGCLLSASED